MICHLPSNFSNVNMSVKRDPVQLSISRRTFAIVPTMSISEMRDLIPVAGPFRHSNRRAPG